MKRLFTLLWVTLLTTFLTHVNAQSISYNSYYDLSTGVSFSVNQSISGEESYATDLIFSPDGLKAYTVGWGADEINQYSLSTPYDINSGITHDGSLAVGTEEASPQSITFNADGSRIYMLGSNSDRIHQYGLSSNYDITSTVTNEGNYYVGLGNPTSFSFNDDGSRFFVGTTSGHIIYQYNLSNAFDVTSGTITAAGSSESFYYSVYDFVFIKDGLELMVLGTTDVISHFSLATSYDISSTRTEITEALYVSNEESDARGLAFSPVGSRFFIVGTSGDDINQYDLNPPFYREDIKNDGSLSGSSSAFYLEGESFTNAGATLSYGVDYTITNLPTGLSPQLNVSSGGLYATLSFSGQATANQNSDDVSSLTFTFNNSAFTGGDASSVTNAVGASSGISLDFRNNGTPTLAYGVLPSILGANHDEDVFNVTFQDATPTDLTFNSDGTKLFMIGWGSDAVYEYDLTTPYDITTGISYSFNSYSVGTDETLPTGLAFSSDGLTMFVTGQTGDDITQYSLSSAFDLTSTITNEGTFDVSGEASTVNGVAFSPDGMTMLVCGPDLYQYSLSTPFDITSGVDFIGTYDQTSVILSAVFGPGGSQILYSNSSRAFGIYDLEVPYDITYNVTVGSTISVLSQDTSPTGVAFSPDRKKLFMIGSGSDNINQYNTSPGRLEESYDDDGSIQGSVQLRIVDDAFINAGSSLTEGVHYSITGLPSGLTSSINVSSDALTAELVLSGTASSHTPANNVSNLEFTFDNSAFLNSNAADVINALGADSYFAINFKDLQGAMFSESGYQLSGLAVEGTPLDVSGQTISPGGMAFSNDGLKLFVTGVNEGTVIQYALSTPYDVTSGVTLDGTPLDVSADETGPYGLTFNRDGSKMYVTGVGSDKLHQYSLSSPFDINSTVTHEGDIPLTNGAGIAFSRDGSRMYTTTTSNSYLSQYSLSVPYDITGGVSLMASVDTGGGNPRNPTFSPDGRELFILSASHKVIYRYSLTDPFDITDGLTSSESFSVTSQDTAPLGMAIGSAGSRFFVSGGTGDDINQYLLPGTSFTEVSANSGAVNGSYTFKINGDFFTNAGATLDQGIDYTFNNVPSGLTPVITVSANGLSATLTFEGTAVDHQDVDGLDADVTMTFLDGAFVSGDASVVQNTTFIIPSTFDFNDNGNVTFTPGWFNESYLNNGAVEGSMTIQITGETFTYPGGTMTEGVDFNVSGIPDGLEPVLTVGANGLSATMTLSGNSTSHTNDDDVADLVFTFENSAFAASDAEYVFGAINASTGSIIDFNDLIPSVYYGNRFDLTQQESPEVVGSFSIVDEDSSPTEITFSNDGLKMFMLGAANDAVFQYNLTTPFDVSSGVSYSGISYDVSGEETTPTDVDFNNDGTKMYVLGSSDNINQYSLSAPYDLGSTVTLDGQYDLSNQDIQPSGIVFSPNGKKMYMIGSFNDQIFQYTLKSAFDVTDEVSYDGTPFTVAGRNYTGILISRDGKRIFTTNGSYPGASGVYQYVLTTPFDMTSGISLQSSYSFFEVDPQTGGMFLDPFGKSLLMLGGTNQKVFQYALDTDGFIEVILNNGEVEGSLELSIKDEQFSNAGATLTLGDDYTINNLPDGLTPTMSVAADGFSATLTLEGNATAHQDADDVMPLNFTFNNSAFFGGDASSVANATSAESYRYIDFRDNNPAVLYGDALNMAKATYSGNSVDLSGQDGYPTGMSFNDDGTKIFISGYDNSSIYEYSLSEAFDLSSTFMYTGNSLDVSVNAPYPEDMHISVDGMKLYVLSSDNYSVVQYNMSSAYELSTAAYSGNSFSVQTEDDSPYGLTFHTDGSKMYLGGSSNSSVYQYSLSTPFNLSTASFDGSPLLVENEEDSPTGLVFSKDGRYLIIAGDGNERIARYVLNAPFDITEGAIFDGTLFDPTNEDSSPTAITTNADGSQLFMVAYDNVKIYQYDIIIGGFEEAVANDGTLDGQVNFYMLDDTFTNASGTLTYGSDYSIGNMPDGLTPVLTVTADGYSATLTFNGSSTMHGNTDDVEGLEFTFMDGAFTDYAAGEVTNAINYVSDMDIDFSPYAENDILTFTFNEIEGTATIDDVNHTVTAEAVAGSDISALSPTIEISTNASILPDSDTEQDFSTAFTYTVTAEDGGVQDWEVTITEALADPTDIELSSNTIDENLSIGATVGTLSSIDASFNDSHTYTLVAGTGDADNASFDISADLLISNETFDFETKGTYNVRIQTNDGNGGLYEEAFIISVNDLNEAPTDIALSANTIDETYPIGTVIGAFTSTDEDESESHTYTLVPDGMDELDNASFNIVNGELVSDEVFDFETKNSYQVHVRTTDQGSLTYEETFTITIGDLPPQVTAVNLSGNTVDENVASGTVVGTLSTFGEDLSGSFTYSLVTGTGDTDNATFTITGDELKVAGSPDFETQNSYSVRVQTDDGAGIVGEVVLSISVNDLSEAPSDIQLSNLTVAENESVGTVIGTLSTTDQDAGETYTYSLVAGTGDTDNTNFSISGDELLSAVSFNFEDQTSYSIRIQTNDGNGGTYEESFTITITDVDESSDNSILAFTIPEQTESPTIDAVNHTVEVIVPSGQDVTALVPTITVATGASVLPASGIAQDFSSAVTYTVTAEDDSQQDWVVTVVNKQTQTITFDAIADMTYGDAALTLSATTSSGLDVTYSIVTGAGVVSLSGSELSIIGSGDVTIEASQSGDSYTDAATPVEQSFTVEKAGLDVVANDVQISIGDDVPSLTYQITGFVNGEDQSALSTSPQLSTTATNTSPVGEYDIVVSGAAADNYSFSYQNGLLTISKLEQSITVDAVPDKTYGDASFMLSASSSSGLAVSYSVVAGPVSLDGNTISITAAGDVQIEVSQSGDDTYAAANSETISFSIAQAALTVTADAKQITYGDALPELTYVVAGFVNNEDESDLTMAPQLTTDAMSTSGAGTYAISVSGTTSDNYTIEHFDGVLTIGKAILEVTADDLQITYGANVPDLTYTISGFVHSDDETSLDVAPSISTDGDGSGAGTFAIIVDGGSDSNYDFIYNNGELNIAKAVLEVVADDQEIAYGTNIPELNFSISGFVAGEDESVLDISPTATTNASDIAPAGTYTISVAGGEDANYDFSYQDGTLTITKVQLTVAVNNQTMVYGEMFPELTYQVTGFVNGEDESAIETLPVTETDADDQSDVGEYVIRAGGASAINYQFEYLDGILSITKAQAEISATNLEVDYNREAQLPVIATKPAGLNYNLEFVSGTEPVEPGSYDFKVTIDETNYEGVFEGTFTIREVLGLPTVQINVYPNPVVNTLTIDGNLSEAYLSVYNLEGRRLFNGFEIDQIDMSEYPNGIYILEVNQPDNIIRLKIIKH